MNSRVFLVEEVRRPLDLTKAAAFGELVTTLVPRKTRWPSVFNQEGFATAFLTELEGHGFNPDVDYFLVVGSTLGVSIAYAALALKYRRFRALVYNSSAEDYMCKEFNADVVVIKGDTSCRPTGILT